MNQKNGKNSLGIDIIFEELDNPIELFKKWFSKAEKSEINDPNAVAIATSNKHNQSRAIRRLVIWYKRNSAVTSIVDTAASSAATAGNVAGNVVSGAGSVVSTASNVASNCLLYTSPSPRDRG